MSWSRAHRLPRACAPGEVAVEATAITVLRGRRPVLDRVDLAVRSGQIVALVGPNGAGKSTLLGVLSGEIPPAAGSVTIDGAPLSSWTIRELAFRRAVLPQQTMVTFPFLVREIVAMGRAPWAGTPQEAHDAEAIDDAIRTADIGGLRTRPFTTLSGGERARVAFARTLAQQTRVLFLDEPTAALDIHHQELLLHAVRERARAGCAAVVVVHDLDLAAAYADRVVVLANGSVVAQGVPAAVLHGPLLSEVYGHRIDVIRPADSPVPLVRPHRPPNGNP